MKMLMFGGGDGGVSNLYESELMQKEMLMFTPACRDIQPEKAASLGTSVNF
jgi:hypothetical protein